MIKKILYIAFKNEYGQEINGLALNYRAWYENFVKLGYTLETIFFDEHTREGLQKEILLKATEFKPDLIFFILQSEQVEINTLKELRRNGFFTVNFFGDDQWRFEDFTSRFAPYLSACITTDKFSLVKYNEIGQGGVIRSQWASLECQNKYVDVNYKYDVSFIGGSNRYRKWFVSALKKRGVRVHCFGSGWDNGRVTYEQAEDIFATSRINLNISNSTNYDIRYLWRNFKAVASILKSSNFGGKQSSQIKARNFEIPVQGGFQLTDYVPSLDDYFVIGNELACYNSIDEAECLIKHYLRNTFERELIKEQGVLRARNEHTFKHRIIEFMEKLNEIKIDDNI